MSEHIDNSSSLLPGGHTWIWSELPINAKMLNTAGTVGSARMVLGSTARAGVITGRDGGPAMLTAASDAALTSLENALEAYCASGAALAWEDDAGRSGSYLVLVSYVRLGERLRSIAGDAVWQPYQLRVLELSGVFA